jgi:hypothetical protein
MLRHLWICSHGHLFQQVSKMERGRERRMLAFGLAVGGIFRLQNNHGVDSTKGAGRFWLHLVNVPHY